MKFLVLFAVIFVAVWLWLNNRKGKLQQRNTTSTQATTGAKSKQQMVACAHCGVHLPLAEALASGAKSPDGLGGLDGAPWFCTAEHRKLGAAKR